MLLLIRIGLGVVLIPSLAYAVLALGWAAAAPMLGSSLPPQRHDTCADLRAVFPDGLAATDEATRDGMRRPLPRVYAQAYVLNMHLDKDHDGIACVPRAAN